MLHGTRVITLFGLAVTCALLWFVFVREAPDTEEGDHETIGYAVILIACMFAMALLNITPAAPTAAQVAHAQKHLAEACWGRLVMEQVAQAKR